MALPPQIAVPVEIRNEEFPRTRKSLPRQSPTMSVNAMPSAVSTKPLRPAFNTSCRSIPKPSATTEAWRRNLAELRASAAYGCAKLRPKRIPMVSATGGERIPVNERTRAAKKRIFESAGIDGRESIRVRVSRASTWRLARRRRYTGPNREDGAIHRAFPAVENSDQAAEEKVGQARELAGEAAMAQLEKGQWLGGLRRAWTRVRRRKLRR